MTVRVNNGFRTHLTFPFGWEGSAGVVRLDDGRLEVAYPSALAPPTGFRMTFEGDLFRVAHVKPGSGPHPMTVLTLNPIGKELP